MRFAGLSLAVGLIAGLLVAAPAAARAEEPAKAKADKPAEPAAKPAEPPAKGKGKVNVRATVVVVDPDEPIADVISRMRAKRRQKDGRPAAPEVETPRREDIERRRERAPEIEVEPTRPLEDRTRDTTDERRVRRPRREEPARRPTP